MKTAKKTKLDRLADEYREACVKVDDTGSAWVQALGENTSCPPRLGRERAAAMACKEKT